MAADVGGESKAERWREVKTKCEGTEEIDKDKGVRESNRALEHELSTYGLTGFPL